MIRDQQLHRSGAAQKRRAGAISRTPAFQV
jgi:hypothetical protein